MGWITVETPNAIYKVVQEMHIRKSRIPPKVDATILELDAPPMNNSAHVHDYPKAYSNIIPARNNPLFTGDINGQTPVMNKSSEWAFAKYVAGTFLTLGLIFPPTLLSITFLLQSIPGGELGKVRKGMLRMGAKGTEILTSDMTPTDFRDALIAKKAEEIIAPEMRRRMKRKPVIAIVYGAAHVGIVDCLRKPSLRRKYLSAMPPEKLAEQDALSHVVEIEYDAKTSHVKRKIIGETHLPKFVPAKRRMAARARLLRQKFRRRIN